MGARLAFGSAGQIRVWCAMVARSGVGDKEKNIQLEMERQCSSSAVSCGASALEPSSPTLDPARLKEAIEADR